MAQIKLEFTVSGCPDESPLGSCGLFAALVLESKDPLATNNDQFIEGQLCQTPSFNCLTKEWLFVVGYDNSSLTDPLVPLTQEGVSSIGCGETLLSVFAQLDDCRCQLKRNGSVIELQDSDGNVIDPIDICLLIAEECPPTDTTLDPDAVCDIVTNTCPVSVKPAPASCNSYGPGFMVSTAQFDGRELCIESLSDVCTDIVGDAQTATHNLDISGPGFYEPNDARTDVVTLNNPSTCRSMIYEVRAQYNAAYSLREFGEFDFVGLISTNGGAFGIITTCPKRFQIGGGLELQDVGCIHMESFGGGTIAAGGSISFRVGIGVTTNIASPTNAPFGPSLLVSSATQVQITGWTAKQ